MPQLTVSIVKVPEDEYIDTPLTQDEIRTFYDITQKNNNTYNEFNWLIECVETHDFEDMRRSVREIIQHHS